jgi:ketosteroid isomerase-like protein
MSMTPAQMKQFVQNALVDVVEDMGATEKTFAKYFSPEYIQYVDGRTLDYNSLVEHMKAQKSVLKSAKITFKHLIAEDNKVASVHVVKAIKKDGGTIEAQVNALIELDDEKIVLCDELTLLI